MDAAPGMISATAGQRVVPYAAYVRYTAELAKVGRGELLRYPSAFLQTYAKMYNGRAGRFEPLVLEPWQVYAVDDPAGQAIYLKPRQVGFSFLRAARGLANSMIRQNYIAAFVSYNRDEAKNKIIYCRQLFESMEYKGKPKLIRDNAAELGWNNGSRVISLPAKAVRGLANPDVFFDEWAFIPKASEIFSGTLSSGVRGLGAFAGGSTPYGESNHFFEVFSNDRNMFPAFVRHRIEWWYSPAMCVDVPGALVNAPLMSTDDRVAAYGTVKLREIRAGLPLDDFQREHECSFTARDDTVIPRGVLLAACEWPEDDDGQPDLDRLDCVVAAFNQLTVAALQSEVVPLLSRALKTMHPTSTFAFGYDVGRSGDGAQLAIVEERRDGQRISRAFVRLSDTQFHVQEALLMSLCADRRFRKAHIDGTGLGMQLTENVRNRFVGQGVHADEGSVIAIDFGVAHKRQRVFAAAKQAIEGRHVLLYPHDDLFKHFAAFKREPEAGQFGDKFILLRGKNSDGTGHHADLVVALGLALYEIAKLKPRTQVPDVREQPAARTLLRPKRNPLWGRTPSGLYVPGGAL